jgi:hypothetical protein
MDYAGPILSIDQMTYNFGYGKLSAGSLSSELGGKSFGVYGQGPLLDSDGVVLDLSSACEKGIKLPNEDPDKCTSSYIAVTVLFEADNSGEAFLINAKSYDWRTDIDFSEPVTPSKAIYPDYPALLSATLLKFQLLSVISILFL